MEISKRDYFAAQALVGILGAKQPHSTPREAAVLAFEYADAMLKLSRTLGNPIEIDPEELERREKAGEVLPKVQE